MSNEIWKQVVIDNIECNYEISNQGNLRNKTTLELCNFHTNRNCYTSKIKVGSELKVVRIARLVAQHFMENPDNLRFIKHINENVYDNRIENLKWSETSLNDGVATVDKNIRISYDLLILISKNEYLKIKID